MVEQERELYMSRHEDHPMRSEGEFNEPKPRRLGPIGRLLDRFDDDVTRAWVVFLLILGLAVVLSIPSITVCGVLAAEDTHEAEIQRIKAYEARTKAIQEAISTGKSPPAILITPESP
jgi:hypothetical protein